jgi:hypothetical protein
MNRILFVLVLAFLVFSCSEDEKNVEQQNQMFEQVVSYLKSEGYSAVFIDQNEIAVSGFKTGEDVLNKLNEIFEKIGYCDATFDVDEYNSLSKLQKLECYASKIYDSGRYYCQNYLCIGDSSFSILDYFVCDDGECWTIQTTCIRR